MMSDFDIDKILKQGNEIAKNFKHFDVRELARVYQASKELSKQQKDVIYMCEVRGCMNPSHIRVISYEGATGRGKDDNDVYFCIKHFNHFRNMMNVDVTRLRKRKMWEQQQGVRK